MGNRKAIWILLPLVTAVWGVIIYKVIVHFNGEGITRVADTEKFIEPAAEQKVYTLALNYSDPFLRTAQKPAQTNKTSAPTNPRPREKKITKPAADPKRPVLRYNGRVENRTSKAERHIILVNGVSHIVTIGQNADGVVLKKIFQDSVQFNWGKETLYVRK